MARRRRPIPCGEAAPISEKRRLRRLNSGVPTERRPYQLMSLVEIIAKNQVHSILQ